ncbi:DUF4350 domain-containing protein [Mobiluncus porci]|uniref:DUF4350 domain-containing protein n=1 Tax=Mobiluncus porci TaxID=2652278 RepID=A0A7K0K321_9ACTO|nr:DUF4350 domain-containing protein [Mobiluncus porci]
MSFNTAPTATPRVGEALHQARWIIGGFLLLLVSAVVFGLISNPTDDNQLSIHNPRPNGAMALAEVLKDRGVKVHDVYTPRDASQLGENDLLVITGVRDLSEKHLQTLMESPTTNVLFLGTFAQSNRLEPYVSAVGESNPDGLAPRCKLPAAFEAGPLHGSRGSLEPLREPAAACYEVAPGKFAYLKFVRPGGLTVSFLSEGKSAQNQEITKGSNAAFLLNLMQPADRVGWVVGRTFQLSSPSGAGASPDMVPPAFTQALLLFFAALLVLGLAKGRRLGRIVKEELPVVVHGSETIQGRARMYRNMAAFETTAKHARSYTARKLGENLHLPTPLTAQALCWEVANYIDLPVPRVEEILLGRAPRNATELMGLLKDLNSLVQKTKRKEQK